jgi:hypothetical protein
MFGWFQNLRAFLFLGLVVLASGQPAYALVLNAELVEDVYIDSQNPNTPNDSSSMHLGRSVAAVTRAGFLQWRLPKLPASGYQITSATLRGRQVAGNDMGSLVMGHLSLNPVLTNLTWNTASNSTLNIHSGRDAGSPYCMIWGSAVTLWTGEDWVNPGVTQYVWTAYTDNTPTNGMVKFLNQRISVTSSSVVTFVTGPAAYDCLRNIYTSEKAVAPPPGPWMPTLSLTIEPLRGSLIIIR